MNHEPIKNVVGKFFTPAQVEAITGVTTSTQRNWRQLGLLKPNEGHARFDALEVICIDVLRAFRSYGLGAQDYQHAAAHAAHMIHDRLMPRFDSYTPGAFDVVKASDTGSVLVHKGMYIDFDNRLKKFMSITLSLRVFFTETVNEVDEKLHQSDEIEASYIVFNLEDMASDFLKRCGPIFCLQGEFGSAAK